MQEVKSSAFSHLEYDEPRKELSVRFHSGKTHVYEDVSREEYHELLTSESMGKHFSQHIRNKTNRPA
jgi:KTSC domain